MDFAGKPLRKPRRYNRTIWSSHQVGLERSYRLQICRESLQIDGGDGKIEILTTFEGRYGNPNNLPARVHHRSATTSRSNWSRELQQLLLPHFPDTAEDPL